MINLTQHKATQEQISAGVIEPAEKQRIQELLTFNSIPTKQDMIDRASTIALIALKEGALKVMIGGAPFFMSTLENELNRFGIRPFYAFSVRESKEVTKEGKTEKISVFVHKGFVEAE